jgi:hypothetical protein
MQRIDGIEGRRAVFIVVEKAARTVHMYLARSRGLLNSGEEAGGAGRRTEII